MEHANDNRIRVLDLFSAAAGGWSLGMHRAGYRTIAACEVIDWRRALYSENNPGVPVYDDVTTLTADRLVRDGVGLPDIVVGSPPCQDISSANTKGKGVDGERSSLYFEAVRVIDECRPRWFALENSANLRTRGADRVINALAAIGYTCWPFVVSAGDVGANHERKRSWLIGFRIADADSNQLRQQSRWSSWASRASQAVSEHFVDGQGDVSHANDEGKLRSGEHAEVGVVPSLECYAGNADCESSAAAPIPAADEGANDFGGGRLRSIAESGRDGALLQKGDDANSGNSVATGWNPLGGRFGSEEADEGIGSVPVLQQRDDTRNPANSNEAGQEAGLLESSLRPAQEPDHGCGDGRGDDGEGFGQMGRSARPSPTPAEPWADWNGGLAHHLRVDDGLSGWVAQSRIAVGGPKGTVAASLIVEAFGDAVCPQIPEAIGRAIMRVERALAAITAKEKPAAANDNDGMRDEKSIAA